MDSPTTKIADKNTAVCFSEALGEELREILKLRKKRRFGGEDPSSKKQDSASQKDDSKPRVDAPRDAASDAKRIFEDAHDLNLLGLAFSGGGIRSATFNLGILQGLANHGLLRFFDYLSTVSGGGYIGSWLESWILRAGQEERQKRENPKQDGSQPKIDCKTEAGIHAVERELRSERVKRHEEKVADHKDKEPVHPEPPPIHFLREYSNYLTPRKGLLSGDTWTMVAIYLRNVLLNQLILVLFLFSLLLLPYLAAHLTRWLSQHPGALSDYSAPTAIFVLVTVAMCLGARNLKGIASWLKDGDQRKGSWFPQTQKWILATIIVPLFLAAWILTAWIYFHPEIWKARLWGWFAGGLLGVTLPWIISCALAPKQEAAENADFELKHRKLVWIGTSFAAGPFSGLLMFLVAHEVFVRLQPHRGSLYHLMTFGVPLVMMVFLLSAAIQIGLMGRTFFDVYREWWARVAGWLFILSIMWIAVFSLTFYAPLGLMWLKGWMGTVGVGWIITTLIGVIRGYSAKTGDPGSKTWKDTALSVTPYVFLVGLVSLLSLSLELILARLNSVDPKLWCAFLSRCPDVANIANWVFNLKGTLTAPTFSISGTAVTENATSLGQTYICAHWQILDAAGNWHLLPLCLAALALSVVLSWRVNLNEFSMNFFYRKRLERCYLGASNSKRNPNPFTGFDAHDTLLLKELQSKSCYSGPFPIFNGTLNLVSTRDLAWQERKAASFTMTPLRCGYDTWLEHADLSDDHSEDQRREPSKFADYAYRPADQYGYRDGGLLIGNAVSISGAALSPNMGYHSSPPLSALLAFFNVRLGFWAGNPRDNDSWTRPGPKVGLWKLLAELFASTNETSRYVYLSDGGHFENLGIYELVKRRCRIIVACDAGADPDYTLEDLGNAISKCREDIGVEIELYPAPVIPPKKDAFSPCHSVVGTINYQAVDGSESENGLLVYIKASLTGDEPADVRNYHSKHPDFPHQSTAEQWFTESQFESYRRLGQHVMESILGEIQPAAL
ncbi:MAG: patatin-like phospholipase family protein, partial [Acidobacteriia bacterium]|nr:patatin-like phospholipase family protein [Terriglobia bacterium]